MNYSLWKGWGSWKDKRWPFGWSMEREVGLQEACTENAQCLTPPFWMFKYCRENPFKKHRGQRAPDNFCQNYSRLNYGKAVWTKSIPHYSFLCPTSGQYSRVSFPFLTAHLWALFPNHHFSFISSLFFSLFPQTQISSLKWFLFLCVPSPGSQKGNRLIFVYFERQHFLQKWPIQLYNRNQQEIKAWEAAMLEASILGMCSPATVPCSVTANEGTVTRALQLSAKDEGCPGQPR